MGDDSGKLKKLLGLRSKTVLRKLGVLSHDVGVRPEWGVASSAYGAVGVRVLGKLRQTVPVSATGMKVVRIRASRIF